MTIPVGDHGLKCLDPDDYAAIALYMQDQATVIDTVIDGISDSLDRFYLRPGFTSTTTASGSAATGGEALIGIGSWGTFVTNFTPTPTIAPTFGVRFTVPRTGWYEHGLYASLTAVGAITAFSRRTLFSRASRITGTGNVLLSEVVWRTADTNTGGEFLVASGGEFYATIGQTIDVTAFYSHTNAASNVQVNTGSRMWCFFTGSGVEIGSA